MQRLHARIALVVCITALFCFPLAHGQGQVVVTSPQVPPVTTTSGVDPATDVFGPVPGLTAPIPPLTPGAGSPIEPAVIALYPHATTINDPAWKLASVATSTSGAQPAELVNVSVRAAIAGQADTLIAGAGVTGSGKLTVLARAIGPGLRNFGVADALTSAPELSIHTGSAVSATTNTLDQLAVGVGASIGAFPGQNSDPVYATGDTGVVGQVGSGTFTALCRSPSGLPGTGMLEFYNAGATGPSASARFINFSARGNVGTGNDVMVVGFVVRGEGSVTLLIRGIGPSLQAFGVTGVLSDPTLELYAGSSVIARNDDWQATDGAPIVAAAEAVGAFALSSPKESALLVTLSAGAYTLHVRGATSAGSTSGTGAALAEIYEVPPAGTFDAARSVNALGLELFHQLTANPAGDNLIISPYSIESAFALAYAGAAGGTRTEMAQVLHLPSDNLTLVGGMRELSDALTKAAADSVAIAKAKSSGGTTVDPIQWQLANRIFGQTDYPFRDSYLTLLANGFGAPLQSLDFAAAPDPSRVTINDWVANVTRDKIKDLIPPRGIDAFTRFVLVNALYLKAAWDMPFPKYATSSQLFHLGDGTSVDVPTMHLERSFGYAKHTGYSVVTLPYIGNDVQFVILLPDPAVSVDNVSNQLTVGDLTGFANLATQSTAYVALWLPRFKVAGPTLSLADGFVALGMKSAFGIPNGAANFDGIAPRETNYLELQRVFHKTFVAVDEEGTEAAAATAIVGGTTAIPVTPTPIEFRVDRPFLFAIQHRSTGAVLFLGRIMNPIAD